MWLAPTGAAGGRTWYVARALQRVARVHGRDARLDVRGTMGGRPQRRRASAQCTDMNDTTPEVTERYRTLLMRRSGSDRLRMAYEMFDCARQVMIARIKAVHPDLPANELRVKIFECTYVRDFEPRERARIIARLRSR